MPDINDIFVLCCFAALFPIGISGYVRHDYTALIPLGIVCALFLGVTRARHCVGMPHRGRSMTLASRGVQFASAAPTVATSAPAYAAPARHAYTRRLSLRRLIRLIRRGVSPRLAARSERPFCVERPPRVVIMPRSSESCATMEQRTRRR